MKNKDNNLAYEALERLRRRLLDLTGRNRLINFRHTKGSSLRIIDEIPDQLVEHLLNENEMFFKSVPDPKEKQLFEAGYIEFEKDTNLERQIRKQPNAAEWAAYLGMETSYEVPFPKDNSQLKQHTDNHIQTLMFSFELETRLRNLRQKAETAIEETGANILYLALGFLEWFESYENSNARIAPLYLVPVRLIKGKLNSNTGIFEYKISYSGEDIIPNISLREKLKVDFGLALPDLDDNILPEQYFQRVSQILNKSKPNWTIHRYISLSLLNFSTQLMYLDLDINNWPDGESLLDHSLVSQILTGSKDSNIDEKEPDLGFGEEYEIDEITDINNRYPLIDDADSSQHSVIVDALNNKNIVVEGPPGTGKSQTITNLIAAAISKGKKVLFIAEKLAALEVVKRRLDASKLGDFCLELHSHKTQKRKLIADIHQRIKKYRRIKNPNDITHTIYEIDKLTEILKSHAVLVNTKWKYTDKTIHQILMAATRYREELGLSPEKFHPSDNNTYSLDSDRIIKNCEIVNTFQQIYLRVINELEDSTLLSEHPWYGVNNSDLQIFDIPTAVKSLTEWQHSIEKINDFREVLSLKFNRNINDIPSELEGLGKLLSDLEKIEIPSNNEMFETLPFLKGQVIKDVKFYIDEFENIQKKHKNIRMKVGKSITKFLPSIELLSASCLKLINLVSKDINMIELNDTIVVIGQIKTQLSEIENIMDEFNKFIGREEDKFFIVSESGLEELKFFLKTVYSLKPRLWNFRDDIFDNDALDETIPEIKSSLEALTSFKNEIEHIYSIPRLPKYKELEDIKFIIQNAGVFQWFKGSWWRARKKLKSLARRTSIKFADLISHIDKAIVFSSALQNFNENKYYKSLLGDKINGLETDLELIEGLRKWYREIRGFYGVSFGAKVDVGQALIELPFIHVKSVRVIYEQGFYQKSDMILEQVNKLREIFDPVKEIKEEHLLLIGKQGILDGIHTELVSRLEILNCYTSEKSITIESLMSQLNEISELKRMIDNWSKWNFDEEIFQNKLNLKIEEDNSEAILVVENTLKLATKIETYNGSGLISSLIYANPRMETFKAIYSLKDKFRELSYNERKLFSEFVQKLELDIQKWMSGSNDSLPNLIERNLRALKNERYLMNWSEYVRIRKDLAATGYLGLISGIESNDISIDRLEIAYYAGLFDWLSRQILQKYPELSYFSGQRQNSIQNQFVEYDNNLKSLQCARVAREIDQNDVPVGTSYGRVRDYTELSLLKHECNKKSRHISIRQMLNRSGNALLELKPCFMMSPLSVAQYLEPGKLKFDLVVMDEASQIKPEYAIGAIARGTQIVVVGDPKQLPPTNFFSKVLEEEENPTNSEELESILDATLSKLLTRRLRWHYRSQHESLIAFSNLNFYDNNLILFPSPNQNSEGYGIHYSRVDRGCFINRRNMEEAKRIAESVKEHFLNHQGETIGVVAMNSEQRDQIETAIERLAKENKIFQVALESDQNNLECLFIKNLENVQGDERDVILISMTYGPQEPGGKIPLRFGPINQEAGWRRLNVLFTRARKRMLIFSSMCSDEIILQPNSSLGLKALRNFLAYCETKILHQSENFTGRPPDSDFEIAVANALRNEGFDCQPQVGVAGYFIDIAVIDPNNSGRFLMGIECDGATYHSAKSVRDRDRLRQSILERLGWNIKRIWSTDWFKNPAAELTPIIKELKQLKNMVPVKTFAKIENTHIVYSQNSKEISMDHYINYKGQLEEKLLKFNENVIRVEENDVPPNQRLLRPAMIEALLEYKPINKTDYLEFIPSYLRDSTSISEEKYLESIFDIIAMDVINNNDK